MKKNVFIISKEDIVYGNSAAAARMNNYAKALSTSNNVYLLSFDKLTKFSRFKETEKNIFTIQKDSKAGIKTFDIISMFKSIYLFRKLYKGIDGDKYIIYYPHLYTLFFDFSLIVLYRKKLFAEINEVRKFYAEGLIQPISKIRLAIYSFIYENTFKYYRGLIFISNNIKSYYKNKNKNSIVIPILVDSNNIIRKREIQKKNEILFVFTGSVSFPKENLEELINGFKLFSQENDYSKLLLYGPISRNNHNKLMQIINELCLEDKVIYKGCLNRDEVKYVLDMADCLLLPRNNNRQNYYGFSTKLAEYSISGTPIILTNTGVIGQFFEDKKNCLLCDGYDRFNFKDKFIEFISLSESEKLEISNNAIETAKLFFDYRNYSNSLNDFIK